METQERPKGTTRVVCNQIILKEVATELGLTIAEVKMIVDTQSEFTALTMSSSTFDSVRWPYLGVFKSKPKEVQILAHLRGMTKEQQEDFKRRVRRGELKLKESNE